MAPHFSLALSRREFLGGMTIPERFSVGSGDGVVSD
jgi:hypothetical protein